MSNVKMMNEKYLSDNVCIKIEHKVYQYRTLLFLVKTISN